MKYLHNRRELRSITAPSQGLVPSSATARCDEPEIDWVRHLARRRAKSLDNLIFVINCNLQRLDGPVRGNGKVIQELEAQSSRGAGWNVIKVIWGSALGSAAGDGRRRRAAAAHG